jgi:hypothetical protein
VKCVQSLVSAALYLLICPVLVWCQASINESLETAFIYVDATDGSDSNPGTASQPLKTIGAAVGVAESNNKIDIGTRVTINPGTYRESVAVAPPSSSTSMPITFEAAVDGTVYVSGAQAFTGWQPYAGNNKIFTDSWPYAWGDCNTLVPGSPPAPDIALRREMVFVNGLPLTQVLSLNEVAWPGTFYVNESGGTIYIWPPTGVNVNRADVEVSVLPVVWAIQGQSNIVVRGLSFEYANPCRENAAVTVSGFNETSNILFDSDSFLWNNAQGLAFNPSVSNFTVQNSVANHNGEAGFQATKVTYGLYQSDQASFNNWRGAEGAYYTWNSGGDHFYQMHDLTLNEMTVSYNQTYGVHFDTDNANIAVTSLGAYANFVAQMLLELSEGPSTISGSTFCGGSPTTSYSGSFGMAIRNSEYATLTGNQFVNANQSLAVLGSSTPFVVTNWQTGQVYNLLTRNVTLSQNVSEAGSSQYVFGDSVGGTGWSTFKTTLSSNYNTWWNSSSSTNFMVPTPKLGTLDNLATWQSTTGQDSKSTWSAPTGDPGSACSPSPDMTDFWFVVPPHVSPATVNRGSSATFVATLVPLMFNGTAQLSYDGVQSIPGATGSWSANSLSANGSATFTLNTSATTPAGTYPVVLLANSGNFTRTTTVLVTVN